MSHPSEASEVLQSTRLPDDLVRVARRIARVAGDESDEAVLAVSLALSAVGNGSVLVDLTDPESALPVDEEDDGPALSWPDSATWCRHLMKSPVALGDQAPLRLEGERLYLHRYWSAERRIADNLLPRIGGVHGGPGHAPEVDLDEVQQQAVNTVLANRVAILTGGPGTGKTYTIARILRAFEDPSGRLPAIALAAPTGKAAARMKQAIAQEQGDASGAISRMQASTLHRLLESVPGSTNSFRRNQDNPLGHDVVIVDETSMVDVGMLDALLAAIRPDSRLILVGDADQLASVAAGNALADLVRSQVVPTVRLTTNYRNEGGVAALAQAIREGDATRVDDLLDTSGDLHWFDAATVPPDLVRDWIAAWGSSLREFGAAGRVPDALAALEGLRVLCAHRQGPHGVATWSGHVIDAFRPGAGDWPLGQPTMVTRNRVVPGLYNGDTGVVIDDGGRVRVAFTEDQVVAPERLGSEATPAYALTVHKAQGSQFDRVAVVLPEPQSRILTRELLYTAVTRARREVAIIGSRDALRAALERRVVRASGLADRLRVAPPRPEADGD